MADPLDRSDNYWFARHAKSIIFLIIILGIIGTYEATQIPVAVFPTTNFPLIKIGVDNGVTVGIHGEAEDSELRPQGRVNVLHRLLPFSGHTDRAEIRSNLHLTLCPRERKSEIDNIDSW